MPPPDGWMGGRGGWGAPPRSPMADGVTGDEPRGGGGGGDGWGGGRRGRPRGCLGGMPTVEPSKSFTYCRPGVHFNPARRIFRLRTPNCLYAFRISDSKVRWRFNGCG